MKIIANIFSIILLLSLLFTRVNAESDAVPESEYYPQPGVIKILLENEKNAENRENIINILNIADSAYKNLFDKLKSGTPLTIFFDPAHGKLPDDRWESETTDRMSCTDLPEEYYSIQISRKIYDKFAENKHIAISSTDDFLSVMKKTSDVYYNIPFSTTMELARKNNAFLIISEHLNNINSMNKAGGKINMKGIHITMDEAGNKYLTNITSVHSGFLTLYNKYDVTGLSERIAGKLKENLVAENFTPNSWDFGTVADDRFSYFYDFPISVIFESGFISNPAEEEKLKDPENHEIIAESQYEAIIDSLNDIFRIDISGGSPGSDGPSEDHNTMIKLSRIAFYYIKKADANKAIITINQLLDTAGKMQYKYNIRPYIEIKNILTESETYYYRGFVNLNAKKWWNSRQNFLKAWRTVKYIPLCYAVAEKYIKTLVKHFKVVSELQDIDPVKPKKAPVLTRVYKAPLYTPVILALDDGQSIQDAIKNSMSPDPDTEQKLAESFNNAFEMEKTKVYNYSRKKKMMIYYYKYEKKKINFTPGIYIVKLNRSLDVIKADRVWQVPLDPYRYQNQQYLQNSYFTHQAKDKSL
ncbi:MAG: N-acetylmuramoyl-L-alanine amidase [Spirochaetes bacterium]|nr:N-acetylmuramoyl-L-alanine amidase [Spirochaetota bacterium]